MSTKIATFQDIIDDGGELGNTSLITLNKCVTKENISLFTNVILITATDEDGNIIPGYSATKEGNQLINIEEYGIETSMRQLTSISTNFSIFNKGSGGLSPVTVTATYSNGSTANVTSSCTATVLSTSESGVASWNSYTATITHGVVGTAIMQFSYTEGGITQTTTVEVITETVRPISLILSPSSVSIPVGESAQISLSMPLNNGYIGNGTYSISYVNTGEDYITASLNVNTITVTGTSITPDYVDYLMVSGTYNGVTITSKLVVEVVQLQSEYITSLYFNGTTSTLDFGDTITLSVMGVINGYGVTMDNSDLTWNSSNPTIAAVINGVVKANTANYEGTTTITASTTQTESGETITTSHGYIISVTQSYLEDCIDIVVCDTNGFEVSVGSDWAAWVVFNQAIPGAWIGYNVYFKVYNSSYEIIPASSGDVWTLQLTDSINEGDFPKQHSITSGIHSSFNGTADNPASYIKITGVSDSSVKYNGNYIGVLNI